MSDENKKPTTKEAPQAGNRAAESGVDRAEQVARLDQRIHERANSTGNHSLSPSMSPVERMVENKQQRYAHAEGSSCSQPGAFPVRHVETRSRRASGEQKLNAIEDRIRSKTCISPSSLAPSSMTDLEAKIKAKACCTSNHTICETTTETTTSVDQRMSQFSKISSCTETHSSLSDIESNVADKVRQEESHDRRPPSEAAREQLRYLERILSTKMRSLLRTAGTASHERGMPSRDDQRAVSRGSVDDMNGSSSQWDHVVEHASRSAAVAVAVPVFEDESELVISAVEYDPDEKMPIRRNRRFRLYGILAVFLMSLVAVGVGVGFIFSEDGSDLAFAHRLNLGIREAVEDAFGAEVLEDESSPYSKALQWITYQDPAMLVPESPNFMQRYILASLYYATSAERPWISCNPPAEQDPDSCFWDKISWQVTPVRSKTSGFRWLSGAPECSWAGLTCDKFGQIRTVDLAGFDLTGSFPVGVIHLPFLQDLSIALNNLKGPLPTEVAQMRHLASIELQHNAFTGPLPAELFDSRNFQRINVGSNRLSGSIADTIQNSRELKRLYVYKNTITGTIPSTVGSLCSLSQLHLGSNLLWGPIPTELGLIKDLTRLELHTNDISGTIPSELGFPSELQILHVSNNPRLSGEIPGVLLSKLDAFEGFNCNLSGNLMNKAFSKSMRRLLIHNNDLTGQLPSDLGVFMPNLTELWISGNQFTGTVPESLCDLRSPFKLKELVADCASLDNNGGPEIVCPEACCTKCCNPSGEACMTMK